MSQPFIEKRRARRRDILERFSFYVSVPKLGHTRHQVKDISELGIGIAIDTLGEFRLKKGEICELQFYVNQSLFLPLHIEVVRESGDDESQEVGATFVNVGTPAHNTFNTLVKLVDQLAEFGEFKNS